MNIDQKIIGRFESLVNESGDVLQTKRSTDFNTYVDSEKCNEWGCKALSILSRVFGKEDDYYKKFDKLFPQLEHYSIFSNALGILKGAKDDYENGFLFETRTLIQAEVFDDFLEQAEYLFEKDYYPPAAVIAGCVLEDGLRQLCLKNQIDLPERPKLDTMNSLLAKKGIYNKLAQKQITTSADLRNKAAHGQWNDFNEEDVKQMLSQVRVFMATHFV